MADIVVQQPAQQAQQLFLLHHGVGATPQGLVPLGQRLAACLLYTSPSPRD